MAFNFERLYDVHLLLGDPSAPPLWHRDVWTRIFRILQPLAQSPRGVPVTGSLQFEGPKRQVVKFGRIGWSEDGQAKWTHAPDSPIRFLSAEIWAPSRRACAKDNLPPDFLFVLWNKGYFATEVTFRDVVLLAVPTDSAVVASAGEVSRQFAELMQARFHGHMTRPWAKRSGKDMSTDHLGDMPTTGLFRVGKVHQQTPGNDILLEHWEPVLANLSPR